MIDCVKPKPKKLSKSDSGKRFTKAQVIKSRTTGNWLASCQEGCGTLNRKAGVPHRVAFVIAETHMKKQHEGNYTSGRIHG